LQPAIPALFVLAPFLAASDPPPALYLQEQVLTATGDAAVSGDTIAGVIGGQVRVFVDGPGGHSLQAVLSPAAGGPPFNRVALAGDVLAAGHRSSTLGGTGSLEIFRRTGSTWTSELAIGLSDLGAEDLAVFANRVAVATRADVFVYRKSAGSWALEEAIASSVAPGACALSSDRLLVRVETAPSARGVDIYRWNGTDWLFEWRLLSDFLGQNEFGWDMQVAGDASIALIGDAAWSHVYVFRRSGSVWTQEARIEDPSGLSTGSFGESVALAGQRAFCSAWTDDIVYAFDEAGGSWSLHGALEATGSAFGTLGYALAATDDVVVASELSGDAYVFRAVPPPAEYCVAKRTSGGCLPAIDSAGVASDVDSGPFLLLARDVPNQKNGLLFYGTSGPLAVPFLGGTLCVTPPLQRTPIQSSGGSGLPADDCSGGYAFDMNPWIQNGTDPDLGLGTVVHAQYWFRDPADPFGASLSDGLTFTILH